MNHDIVKFRISPSVNQKGVSVIGIEDKNFVVDYNGYTIKTTILGNDDTCLFESLCRFEKDAKDIIKDDPLIQNIVMDMKNGYKDIQEKHLKHIESLGPKHSKTEPIQSEKVKDLSTADKLWYSQVPNDQSKTEKPKEVIAYKYSGNGKYKLHESIILGGVPCFIAYDTEKEKPIIKSVIEEQNRIIRPPSLEECPFPPYEFENEQELDTYIKRASEIESIEELYRSCKNFWTLYVDQEKEIVVMLAADSILSYFQDLFPIIHYSEAVGTNDVGKSSIGYTFEYTGYRVVKGASITGPNYFRIFGTVEPGQCVVVEDEGDSISDNPDKIAILKIAYEYNSKIPRTNMNVKNQDMNWFFPYGYKMILAEKSIREWKAKGLVDRTFTMKCRPGRVKYAIKDVVSNIINKSEQYRKLHEALLDFRKLMLCYRLIHYRDRLPNLTINLENRDKELSYPLLELFYGTGVFDEIKESLEYFIQQRHERKANSIEAGLYPIIERLLKTKIDPNSSGLDNYRDIKFADIWESIVTKGEIEGFYDPKRPSEYESKEYGKLFRRSLSSLIADAFLARINHTRTGSQLTFDLRQFETFKERYTEAGNNKEVKIDVSVTV